MDFRTKSIAIKSRCSVKNTKVPTIIRHEIDLYFSKFVESVINVE